MDSQQLPALVLGTNSNIHQTVFSCNGVNNKRMTRLSEAELYEFMQSIIAMNPDIKDPFYVLDLGSVKCIMDQWNSKLPKVRPFYAVKRNPDPIFLTSLAMLGSDFDCASQAEVKAVLALGVSADRIIFANTCKSEAHLKYAASVGVNLATYDSPYEIEKIKKMHPKCALLLQIKVGETKIGALPEEVIPLLRAAHMAHLPVVGVAFHLGTAVRHPEVYCAAIASAKMVFDTTVQLGMPKMYMLDIGGGFTAGPQFCEAADTINFALPFYFGNEQSLEIISEPGRFFAESSFTLVMNIIGKRVRGSLREYWINDGLYGSMTNMLNDPNCATGTIKPLAVESSPDNPTCHGLKTYQSTVYGPICNCFGTILTNYQLPELNVNDWLVFSGMGAYSSSAGYKFNCCDTTAIRTYLAYSKRGEPSMKENKI
ncbi:hypothetical protein AQUCO_00700828v1 [Aquilegia coerulea]|uniref:ornithine decarboxylase n=1 Tax=Aquilegia coerulea TaxID=218851 RepID=A0A2G5ELY6_AQUCA|nr:hypothetical protein AQUCO_00700828v1 [Aquilegia coerulea]